MAWNLPPGVTDRMIDEAAGGYDESPEPCTLAAARLGCICRIPWGSIYEPADPIINRDCPLHGYGKDPDAARDAERDDPQFYQRIIDNDEVPF